MPFYEVPSELIDALETAARDEGCLDCKFVPDLSQLRIGDWSRGIRAEGHAQSNRDLILLADHFDSKYDPYSPITPGQYTYREAIEAMKIPDTPAASAFSFLSAFHLEAYSAGHGLVNDP